MDACVWNKIIKGVIQRLYVFLHFKILLGDHKAKSYLIHKRSIKQSLYNSKREE